MYFVSETLCDVYIICQEYDWALDNPPYNGLTHADNNNKNTNSKAITRTTKSGLTAVGNVPNNSPTTLRDKKAHLLHVEVKPQKYIRLAG